MPAVSTESAVGAHRASPATAGPASITVQHVGKTYRIWESPSARLTAPLLEGLARFFPAASRARGWLERRAARRCRIFHALSDVSFTAAQGESVGIIGRNGSGKSTLLQIIAGTLQPTTGTVQVRGRVAALLELGSGFNPEFTGRENVMLNGAILGFTGAQMTQKFAEIAAFADIGDFIDQPVKIYSSGMMLRLAFAVQTAVEPDILIIDEALSVGDAPFQAKCFARIRHLQSTGCTILFVSHDTGTVQTFCQQALWLSEGQTRAQGDALVVCGAYSRDCSRAMGMDHVETNPVASGDERKGARVDAAGWLAESRAEFEKNAGLKRSGNGVAQIRNFFFVGEKNHRTDSIRWDEEVTAVFVVGSTAGVQGLFRLSISCVTLQGVVLLSQSDRTHTLRLDLAPGGEQLLSMKVRLPLRAGQYSIYTGLFLFPDDALFPEGTLDYTRAIVADSIATSAFITILPQFNLGIYGPVHLDAALAVEPSESPRAPAP